MTLSVKCDTLEVMETVTAMSRGLVVVDENLLDLRNELLTRNIRALTLPQQSSDDLVAAFASHRILITKNTKDFLQLAVEHEIGLISVEGVARDTKNLANAISKALREHSLWSTPKPFLFHLSNNKLESLGG